MIQRVQKWKMLTQTPISRAPYQPTPLLPNTITFELGPTAEEIWIHVFLTSTLDVSGQLQVPAALAQPPGGKIPQYSLNRWPQIRPRRFLRVY